jgi:hypothetical protein
LHIKLNKNYSAFVQEGRTYDFAEGIFSPKAKNTLRTTPNIAKGSFIDVFLNFE